MSPTALGGCLTATLLAIPQIAFAGACAPREDVLNRLATAFGETRQSIGLAPDNQMIEVFASDTTGTWTITVTKTSGVTCLVASGHAFETLAEALPIPEQDA